MTHPFWLLLMVLIAIFASCDAMLLCRISLAACHVYSFLNTASQDDLGAFDQAMQSCLHE